MAESVISDVISAILKSLGSKAYKKLMFANDLDSHIERLKELKSTVESTLRDGSLLESCTHAQQDVLDKLNRALAELDDFLDETEARAERKEVMRGNKFIKAVRLFFSESNQLVAPLSHAHKLKAIMEKFDCIAKDYAQVGSIISNNPCANHKRACCVPATSTSRVLTNLVVGRDKDRDNIVSLLSEDYTASEPLSVHAIVGIGGLGKTTLAWYVYNDERLKSCFDVQFWVLASQNFDLTKVLESIILYGKEERPLDCNMDQLYHHFLQAIRGKKFLLVLDNIWDQDGLREKWLDLKNLLALGAQGSQVLITTRDLKVAELMASVNPYKLGELTEGDSWGLFQKIAFTQWQEPGVEAIGEQIAAMCANIPLVIRSIAGHLAEKRSIKEWQAFRDDQLANFTSYGRHILQNLKLSYDQLDERLKCCVTYFALFPKGYKLEQDLLIQLWMALGYIEPQYRNQSIEDAGEEYVRSLLNRGFLQLTFEPGYRCRYIMLKMHDLMHDLVVLVSGSKYKMANVTTTEFDERVRHLFIDVNPTQHLHWYVPSSIFKMKSLQSFLVRGPPDRVRMSPCSLQDRLAIGFPCLKVLCLRSLGIKELPRSLGDLTCLRYIDLSINPIRKLPNSLKHLKYLLVLNVSFCEELQVLPKGINKLKKLRHLGLKNCMKLTSMPMDLGNLTDLQTLSMFVAGKQSSSGGANQLVGSLADLECLNNLKNELTIQVLGRSENTATEARAANLGMKENLKKIVVEFKDSTKDDEMVLESLQPNANLKQLTICGYAGERLPSWMMNQLHVWLPNLTNIELSNCKGCKYLCSFGRLPHLKLLLFDGLKDVEYIEETTPSTSGSGDIITKCEPMFPRLLRVGFWGMLKLKGWRRSSKSSKDQDLKQLSQAQGQHQLPNPPNLICSLLNSEVDQNVQLEGILKVFQEFSSPKSLTCINCKDVEVIPEVIGNLTSLEHITVIDCPKLKYLPRQISNLTNLKSLRLDRCSGELKHRCSKQGEYWPYIQHIPNIGIFAAK